MAFVKGSIAKHLDSFFIYNFNMLTFISHMLNWLHQLRSVKSLKSGRKRRTKNSDCEWLWDILFDKNVTTWLSICVLLCAFPWDAFVNPLCICKIFGNTHSWMFSSLGETSLYGQGDGPYIWISQGIDCIYD